ncbi:Glucosamine-6-phosphate deaminase 1 [Caprobacter fermentans]|uniref:Glucosamine-6-phosphate deaminase n=1 Tax=Caproicibacter fermentans TaxID=2576756 RepID=A0A6N8HWS2_9FIRM|nr:glucosamine-6-phosphate deaminase [Caproicibacter fermentans]MVB10045.1 Glucosamine-6-phosphate deaminase 1 [Caproicibacter fermentans]OCN02560.1 glucosamine-6-phosphate deaminase [Clostridium sp. W14A]QNK42008.1 glucosamine-6-phosphate deaminase [Caproicibacter fermentans]
MNILWAPDYPAMSRKAANIISAQVILKPDSVLGLATGSTPLGVYRQLVDWYGKGDLDFSRVHSVNLDEYVGLPPDHSRSYSYYMRNYFFSHVNIGPENTNVPDGMAADLDAECERYDRLIESLGGIDLQLLGIGSTGHIGFNEPNEDFDKKTHKVRLKQATIDANSRFFESADAVPRFAVTMGIKAMMQAKKILLIASGEEKAEVLCRSLFGPVTPEVPASILQMHPCVTVVADDAALSVVLKKYPGSVERRNAP